MMLAIQALLSRLNAVAPDLYIEVKNLPEQALIEAVSQAYAMPVGVNPTDWAITILRVIDDGKTPDDGGGVIGPDAEAPGTSRFDDGGH